MFVAFITIVFGTDHPNGKWSERFLDPKEARSKDIEDAGNSSVEGEKVESKSEKGVTVDVNPAANQSSYTNKLSVRSNANA